MKEAHAQPFLHPRHRLPDRRGRHAKLSSGNRETTGLRGLNEGIQRSETVHPRGSIADIQVRYVWSFGPFFKPWGEIIFGLCQMAFTAWMSCSIATSHGPSLGPLPSLV